MAIELKPSPHSQPGTPEQSLQDVDVTRLLCSSSALLEFRHVTAVKLLRKSKEHLNSKSQKCFDFLPPATVENQCDSVEMKRFDVQIC